MSALPTGPGRPPDGFFPEQQRWLEGFVSGAAAIRALPQQSGTPPEPTGPDSEADKARSRAAAGGKLSEQERWKAADNPLDAYPRLRREALADAKPKPDDNFRWRYHGLFHVAPTQDSYMCRLRIANGILKHWQFAAIADAAEAHGGGYSHVTTRANLQIREISPQNGPALLETLADIGVAARGSGADNIRNVTGSATAGIDPHELLDTRPHARAWQHHIFNCRAMFGLPRKFNVAFDGAGSIATLEDTNDIGFQAVEVLAGAPVEAGIWYRLTLGGITGHKDFARDTGLVVRPEEATRIADAIVRVFIAHGDRTNRNKARLKYLLDAWGFPKFLEEVETVLGERLTRLDPAFVAARPAYDRLPPGAPQNSLEGGGGVPGGGRPGPPPPFAAPPPAYDRLAHIGVHRQRQAGLNWIGVALPAGRMTSGQMRTLARIAAEIGDGDIRLTVWQNLLISGVPDARVEEATGRILAAGLAGAAAKLRARPLARPGSRGRPFPAAGTQGPPPPVPDYVEARLAVDEPVNIHLTGCHNSCAQHYIGDIGLIGARVPVGEEGDTVEGYHLHVGGGFGTDAAVARLLCENVRGEEVPQRVEALLRAWMSRRNASESFAAFARRLGPEVLKGLAEEVSMLREAAE